SPNRAKVLERWGSPSQTSHTASPGATAANPGYATGGNGATRCGARSSRRVCGRAFGRGLVCNTRPNPARSDSVPLSVPLSFAEHCVVSTSAPDPEIVGLICVWDMRSALLGSIAESCRGESCFSRWFAPFDIPENQIPAECAQSAFSADSAAHPTVGEPRQLISFASHLLIKRRQKNVTEQGRSYSALRGPALAGKEFPLPVASRFEHRLNQT